MHAYAALALGLWAYARAYVRAPACTGMDAYLHACAQGRMHIWRSLATCTCTATGRWLQVGG